jgi:dTDP-4-dehydrorhamnose 3,5-epimerase
MVFSRTKINGAFEITPEQHCDERGFFARTWCEKEFEANELNPKLVQCSISYNEKRGTLRGMHYQAAPHAEAKLVRCTKGAIYDVVLDLRPLSPSFNEWVAIVLSSENRKMVYVPEGCAHGFLTLEDRTEVHYQMSEFYYPELARGLRWDDPAFKIDWPAEVQVISERDRTYPDFEEIQCAC